MKQILVILLCAVALSAAAQSTVNSKKLDSNLKKMSDDFKAQSDNYYSWKLDQHLKHLAETYEAKNPAKHDSTITVAANTGEVNKVDGMYIYFNSIPVAPHEYLGVIERETLRDTYQDIVTGSVKQAKNRYPQADGLVFSFTNTFHLNCYVVKLK